MINTPSENPSVRDTFLEILESITPHQDSAKDADFYRILKNLDEDMMEKLLYEFKNSTNYLMTLKVESMNNLTDEQLACLHFLNRKPKKLIRQIRNSTKEALSSNESIDTHYSFSAHYGIDNESFDRHCRMAMVVYLSKEDYPAYATPFIAKQTDGHDLDQFFNENFKFSDQNKLFAYYLQGEWKVVGQKEEVFADQQDLLRSVWGTHNSRKREREDGEGRKNLH